jgi:hypothetical protein
VLRTKGYLKVHQQGGIAAHNMPLSSICRDLEAAQDSAPLKASGLTQEDLDCLTKLTLHLAKISSIKDYENDIIIRGSFLDWKRGEEHHKRELARGSA